MELHRDVLAGLGQNTVILVIVECLNGENFFVREEDRSRRASHPWTIQQDRASFLDAGLQEKLEMNFLVWSHLQIIIDNSEHCALVDTFLLGEFPHARARFRRISSWVFDCSRRPVHPRLATSGSVFDQPSPLDVFDGVVDLFVGHLEGLQEAYNLRVGVSCAVEAQWAPCGALRSSVAIWLLFMAQWESFYNVQTSYVTLLEPTTQKLPEFESLKFKFPDVCITA